jgi:hypothetical protein
MEEIELVLGDYIVPTYASSFQTAWEEVGSNNEIVETFQLGAIQTIKGKHAVYSCHNNVHH